ncbi:AbrB/MazE/SpoVT family DNA-binding domain-containing protein [Salinithrix halophila]|uniref:AbrB/MazE/SpoVT family DNA-binding domain-containing protein n=1 Tax=Salinithrix halophila TaxID=1485204 RepID=A0ABV8JBK9_9BACL
MEVSRISSKGQVTVPKSIRQLLDLKEGDRVAFVQENGKVVITKASLIAFQKLTDAISKEAQEKGITEEDLLQGLNRCERRYGMSPAGNNFRVFIDTNILISAWGWESRKRKIDRLSGRNRVNILLFSLAVAGYQVGYFTAVDRTMVSPATLLTVCTAPLLVALFAWGFLRERIQERTGIALILRVEKLYFWQRSNCANQGKLGLYFSP